MSAFQIHLFAWIMWLLQPHSTKKTGNTLVEEICLCVLHLLLTFYRNYSACNKPLFHSSAGFPYLNYEIICPNNTCLVKISENFLNQNYLNELDILNSA